MALSLTSHKCPYKIDITEDGILSWTFDIKSKEETYYAILQEFVEKILSSKFKTISTADKWICNNKPKPADFKNIDDLKLVLTGTGGKFFRMIQDFLCSKEEIDKTDKKDTKEEYIEIKVDNSYERLVIYTLCIIFGLKCSKVRAYTDVYIPCTYYLPTNKGLPYNKHETKSFDFKLDDVVCGCDYAPKSFRKHHSHNDYDDAISYSKFKAKIKVAVRVYK